MARKTKYELKKPRNDPSMKVKETNLPAKKYKHSNPTELTLCFEVDGSSQNYAYIDLAQALTIVNRKLYRQHAYYYVQKVSLYDNATNFVDVMTAPDTYVTRNAVVRGKAIWDDMNERVAGKTGGFIPKFHDYKVRLDGGHVIAGNLMPAGYTVYSSTGVELPSGEWNYSHYVSADSDQDGSGSPEEFTAHIMGDDQTNTTPMSMGLIKSYGLTRRAPYDENPVVPVGVTTDDFLNLIDYSDEEQVNSIIDHLDRHNDDTPYSETEYIGTGDVNVPGVARFSDQLQHRGRLVTVSGISRVSTIGGFCAPFGLIGLDLNDLDGAARIVITLAPGTYHGVLAERV